jgi:hypothetical protein
MSEYPAVQYPKARRLTSVRRRNISRFLDAMLARSRSTLENGTRSERRFLQKVATRKMRNGKELMLKPNDRPTLRTQEPAGKGTRPVKAAEPVVDFAISNMIASDYAAAFASRACFQFQGRSSSIRFAG